MSSILPCFAGEPDGRQFLVHYSLRDARAVSRARSLPAVELLRHPAQPVLRTVLRAAALHCRAPGARHLPAVRSSSQGGGRTHSDEEHIRADV